MSAVQANVFRLIAALLHLGNIKFCPHENAEKGEEGSRVLEERAAGRAQPHAAAAHLPGAVEGQGM